MDNLEKCRKQINEIDDAMAVLFEQRMQAARMIGEYKKEHGLPVKDQARENAIIAKGKKRISEKEFEGYYVDFQKSLMSISCALQEQITAGMKIGYSGVPGAYAYIAAKQLFPEAKLIPFANFEPAYRAAENGEVDCAVLPLENSYAGDVGAVMDLMFAGHLFVNQIYDLDIEHQILGVSGADIKQVRTVVSHPQALSQCDNYIKYHNLETVEFSNTARAAEYVKGLNDPTVAAIASCETASLYGLDILERNIQSMKNNTSRFGVFSRAQNLPQAEARDDSCGFMLMFTVPNEAGSLAITLDIIGAHGFNMRNLKSRPMKDLLWSYYFYVEAEGNIVTDEGSDMLSELKAVCGQMKLIGTYSINA